MQWKKKKFLGNSIRYTVFTYFTITALVAIVSICVSLYSRLSTQMSMSIEEESQSMVNQVGRSLDAYLRNIMKLSDSLYYGAVKNADLADVSINNEITLLYDNNKDNVDNIALLNKNGELLEAVPAARLKSNLDITQENWFQETLGKPENLHFSNPHVQYIFDNSENQYRWVITVSRAVELTKGPFTDQGVLLIDVRYNSLEQLLRDVSLGNGGYIYLVNSDGEIIYHPRAQLLDSGLETEETLNMAESQDGTYQETIRGQKQIINVKSVGYTGWKLIGVTPLEGLSLNSVKTRLFIVFMVALFLFLLSLINAYISSRITNPIKELEKSVNDLEAGDLDAPIYIGGSEEIRHLGSSVQNMASQIQVLMKDIVAEHESKRKSEFDTLQSQINPHFLYNTLDIIVWMIENEKKAEAVKVVTALARFFRISLSRGKSIITVRDELEHVRNYLMIQEMRYKNKFTYTIQAEDAVMDLASLKLMLQPMVENAIYHGMEFMDGDGEINIFAETRDGHLFITVEDNGLGMTEEQVERLFSEEGHVPSRRGSGIGVKNVNERIRLYFGEMYGLAIESEPDEGTKVIIHLPAIPYEEILKKEET
ncbi:MAG: cache domain-containing protein [Lachnospiraceae bacterium]